MTPNTGFLVLSTLKSHADVLRVRHNACLHSGTYTWKTSYVTQAHTHKYTHTQTHTHSLDNRIKGNYTSHKNNCREK